MSQRHPACHGEAHEDDDEAGKNHHAFLDTGDVRNDTGKGTGNAHDPAKQRVSAYPAGIIEQVRNSRGSLLQMEGKGNDDRPAHTDTMPETDGQACDKKDKIQGISK